MKPSSNYEILKELLRKCFLLQKELFEFRIFQHATYSLNSLSPHLLNFGLNSPVLKTISPHEKCKVRRFYLITISAHTPRSKLSVNRTLILFHFVDFSTPTPTSLSRPYIKTTLPHTLVNPEPRPKSTI